MKQVSQDRHTGEMVVLDVPPPALLEGGVLVRTAYSLISAGTERATVEAGREGLVARALRQPEKVRELVDQALAQGVGSVVDKIQNKLSSYQAIGYAAAGVVTDVGRNARTFRAGDRVACAGARASHAETLSVPSNLCARVPDGVALADAAATTLGAIALQGVRQADVRLGENVAVIGLGLLGQIAVQLLGASGCRVLGCDLAGDRVERALRSGAAGGFIPGADDPRALVDRLTRGLGFDAVLLTTSSASNDPLVLAGQLARDRARVVLVGTVGGEVPRELFFAKELSLLLSRSYGPGRYDPEYEDHGHDYPVGFVRWTEKRNMEAFLDLLARGALDLSGILAERYPVSRAPEAYGRVTGGGGGLGIVLEYPGAPPRDPETEAAIAAAAAPAAPHVRADAGPRAIQPRGRLGLGVIGAGGFAQSHLLPGLRRDPAVDFAAVTTAGGLTAKQVAGRFGFAATEDSVEALLRREDVHAVIIASRHDTHADFAARALLAGKHVFVEKPLALSASELERVEAALLESGRLLCVGFNRRFAPMLLEIRKAFGAAAPLGLAYRVNAGAVPRSHWIQDPAVGGGRILGEACHFFDLLRMLADSPATRVHAESFPPGDHPAATSDDACFTLAFANGSAATLGYWASGNAAFPKESLEAFGGGISARLDDFREAVVATPGGVRRWSGKSQDKGHAGLLKAFVLAARGEAPPPIPHSELLHATRITLAAARALRLRQPVAID